MPFTTRQSVLLRIREGDEIGWEEFYELYSPLVRLRGSDRGLASAELDDLSQEVMVSIFQGEKQFRYDRARGRFRDYLRTIIDRRAIDLLRKRRENEQLDELKSYGREPESNDHHEMERRWELAWQEQMLRQGLFELEEESSVPSFQAFHRVVMCGQKPADVARELEMNVDNIYLIKHRLLKRLRDLIQDQELE
ncbi:MAG: sigma-70 family RNA polymerase sigma factor [Planctomycetota bacterium]|jgi:RNA polymerase sigma factor (sigma-70 family)|nr:sigma-70 family RNA polymerase sigma factor [Planctomycetota bacterium]